MIDLNTLAGWMMSILVTLSPLDRKIYHSNDVETPIEKKARLEQVSKDIIDVVFDEGERPLFEGPSGRLKSAVYVATWASHESGGFRKGVDDGHNRGDRGSSWCLLQLHIGKGKTAEGWSGKDLIDDRKKCIRAGYHLMRQSMGQCKHMNERSAMAAYASGRCTAGITISQKRYDHMVRVFAKHPFKVLQVPAPVVKEPNGVEIEQASSKSEVNLMGVKL